MTLPGGPAEKVGNRYERLWTVQCILDVLQGRAYSMRIEVPGQAGEGFEFVVRSESGDAWHQAKRQRSQGSWTPSAMRKEGVLASLGRAVTRGDAAVFVSGTSADDVAELVSRAQDSASYSEFREEFLRSPSRLDDFWAIVDVFGLQEEQAYEALHRITVTTIDEGSLQRGVIDRCSALVTGDPEAVLDALLRLVDDSVHVELTEVDVWARLRERGHEPQPWAERSSVDRAVRVAFDRFIGLIEQGAIDGRLFERPEAGKLIELLEQGQDVTLTGAAGYGKTGVLGAVVRRLAMGGWRVLPVRMDRLNEVADARALGASLRLPESPARVLGAVYRPSVLLIDQLDAVSLASGRSTERFDVVAELLQQTASFSQVRVVVATRTFDLGNDDRFRSILREPRFSVVDVGLLGPTAVAELLGQYGQQAAQLPAQLRELLRSPLNLRLFLDLARSGATASNARSERELLDRYWRLKREQARQRRGGDDEWTELIDVLVDHMSERAALSAPLQVTDGFDRQRDAMISEGVLTSDGDRLGFSHERFFDYCYARRFIGRGQTLRALLAGDEQDLFRRAQVRQVLTHQRAGDRQAYLADLEWLLDSSDVRPHLRALVIDWLGSLSDPELREWRLLRPLLDREESLAGRAWRVFRGAPAWFDYADGDGLWAAWLDNDDDADRAFWALRDATHARPDRVAALLTDRPGSSDEWSRRLARLLLDGGVMAGRPLLELALRCLQAGDFDQQEMLLWHAVEDLAESRPGWAVRLAEQWLRHRVVPSWLDEPGPLGRARVGGDGSQALGKLATAAPGEIVARLLPIVLDVVHATGEPDEHGVTSGAMWSYRIYNARHHLDDALFEACERALTRLVKDAPDLVMGAIEQLRDSRAEPAWFLLARIYAANPERFASAAITWMTQEPAALRLGYSDAPEWVSRELIAAVTAACSDADLEALENVLLVFSTEWERSVHGFRSRGLAQFALLEGIGPQRRSAAVRRRLAEHERKFGDRRPTPPHGIYGGWVGPPIPADRTERMSDRQWVQAMRRYAGRERGPTETGGTTGGAHELASQLEARAKEDPERFAQLLLVLPDDVHAAYPSAILRGLRAAPLDIDLVAAVCRSSQRFDDTARWLPWLLEPRGQAPLPDDVVLLVADTAQRHSEPTGDRWQVRTRDGVQQQELDLDSAAINCVRGSAAYAIAGLLADDAHRLDLFTPALRSACQDQVLAVRAAAAHALLGVMRIDMDMAVQLLLQLLDDTPDALFQSGHVEEALHWAVRRRLDCLRQVLERMLASEDPAVQQAGGRQLALASLATPDLDPRVDLWLATSVPVATGIVEVAAANIAGSIRSERCSEICRQAFHHDVAEIRAAALSCFSHLKHVPLGPYRMLFQAFAESPLVASDASRPLHALEEALDRLPETALLVCEAFVDRRSSTLGDVAHSAAADAYEVSKVVLRIHAQHEDAAIRLRCLDLIDQLVALNAGGVDRELAQFER